MIEWLYGARQMETTTLMSKLKLLEERRAQQRYCNHEQQDMLTQLKVRVSDMHKTRDLAKLNEMDTPKKKNMFVTWNRRHHDDDVVDNFSAVICDIRKNKQFQNALERFKQVSDDNTWDETPQTWTSSLSALFW